jgi:hypothetical protein
MKFILVALAVVLPMPAQDGIKPPPQTIASERVAFEPGGTIHVNGSDGYVLIQGWDQPAIEITVTRSLGYGKSKSKEADARRLENIHIATERSSPRELTISTTRASRSNGVAAGYELHVPRDSRLVIHHGVGYVQVGGVLGDIEARVKRGDILLMLLDSGAYSIGARTSLGKVASDFEGSTSGRFLVGQRFVRTASGAARHLDLRAGFGGITIKGVPAEAETAGTR